MREVVAGNQDREGGAHVQLDDELVPRDVASEHGLHVGRKVP